MKYLIDRLSKLEGPNRVCDEKIWMYLIEKPESLDKIDRDMIGRYPFYTSSVDAAIKLAEQILPGCDLTIRTRGKMAWIDGYKGQIAFGATPAIAAIIAILRAKDASHDL